MIPEDNSDAQFEKLMLDLQTKLAFQEDTVQTLNDIVSDQQKDISQLKAQVHTLIDELRSAFLLWPIALGTKHTSAHCTRLSFASPLTIS